MKDLFRYSLRFAENQRWIVFSITTGACAWLIAAIAILPFALFGWEAPYTFHDDASIWRSLNAILLTPIIENLLFVAAILLLKNYVSSLSVIFISTAIASIVHALYAPLASISAIVIFGLMSFSYFLFSNFEPNHAFRVILIQHIIFNAPLAIGSML